MLRAPLSDRSPLVNGEYMSDGVTDNPARNRFELTVEGITAHIDYERTPGRIVFIHTIVPEALGGKGVGSRLVKAALDMVRAEGLRLVPKCPFVAAYIEKHSEYRDLVD